MDLIIENAQLVNVLTGTVHPAAIGIRDGFIACVLPDRGMMQGEQVLDAEGQYVLPGLIDLYSQMNKTMLTPEAFSKAVLPHGVTTVVTDSDATVQTLGLRGLALYLGASKHLPLHTYFALPTQVPVYPHMESAFLPDGQSLYHTMLEQERVVGIAPLPAVEEVKTKDSRVHRLAGLDGQTPLPLAAKLTGYSEQEKQELLFCGIGLELVEEGDFPVETTLQRGQYLALAAGALTAGNVKKLASMGDLPRLILRTGDQFCDELWSQGHLDGVVRKAIRLGLNSMEAIRSVTCRPAAFAGLSKHGYIAPGMVADLVVMRDLEAFRVEVTICAGSLSAMNGRVVDSSMPWVFPEEIQKTVILKRRRPDHFRFYELETDRITSRVLVANGQNLTLGLEESEVVLQNGVPQLPEGTLRLSVFERYGQNKPRMHGFLKGIGPVRGAVATTFAGHANQLVVLGDNEDDLMMAANMLITSGGGICVVQNGQLIASVDLPIGGICAEGEGGEVAARIKKLRHALVDTAGIQHKNPLLWLVSLCDTTQPGYHLTDLGIVHKNLEAPLPPYEAVPEEPVLASEENDERINEGENQGGQTPE